MAHLIQPLTVAGTKYCVLFNDTRSTEIVNSDTGIGAPTDLATMVEFPGNKWFMTSVGTASTFEVSFGVGCGSAVEFAIFLDPGLAIDWEVIITWHINGNAIEAELLTMVYNEVDGYVVLSLTDYPCGNIITVVASIAQPDEIPLTLSIEILSVI